MPVDRTHPRPTSTSHGEWFQSWNPAPETLRPEGGMAHVPRQRSLEEAVEPREPREERDETR